MQHNHKIALLGGTGKSGRYVVQLLTRKKTHFKMLVRNAKNIRSDNPFVQTVYGNATDRETIRQLLKDSDTVISCLGSGIPPSEPTVFSKTTRNILSVMEELGIKRYILLTGLNVDTPFDKKGTDTRVATDWMYQNYPTSTADRQLEYELLVESHVEWTLVRLPLITLTDSLSEIGTSLKDCKGSHISAASLAKFLLRQKLEKTFIKKAPFVFDR